MFPEIVSLHLHYKKGCKEDENRIEKIINSAIRRKDDTTEFCGTHLKGTPHGICCSEDLNKPTGQKIEVWAQDFQGIIYFIDKNSNVYQTEDIIQGKSNPKIIAKYVKNIDTYSIPDFGV
jgi:hypothetical protein